MLRIEDYINNKMLVINPNNIDYKKQKNMNELNVYRKKKIDVDKVRSK